MRTFVHLSIMLLVLSVTLTAVSPVLAQEPVAAEEAETDAEVEAASHEEEAADAEGEHAIAVEDAAEAHSPNHSDDASAPGATNHAAIALLLTGMIVLFAVGAVAIWRL